MEPKGERFWELQDTLFEGLLCVERRGRIIRWNTAAELITGFHRHEVLGIRCGEDLLLHRGLRADDTINGAPLLATLEDGQTREGVGYLTSKSGLQVLVHIRTARLHGLSGHVIGAVEVFDRTGADQHRMQERLRELEQMAMVDPLLEIPNRRFLSTTLESRFSAWTRQRRRFGVIMMDLDRFKRINDDHGHLRGDRALKAVASALTSSVRAQDVVGRWGGEEFLAIVDVTGGDKIGAVAERFRLAVKSLALDNILEPFKLTLSAGAAVIRSRDTIETLLCRADGKVYEVKGKGGDGVRTDDTGALTTRLDLDRANSASSPDPLMKWRLNGLPPNASKGHRP